MTAQADETAICLLDVRDLAARHPPEHRRFFFGRLEPMALATNNSEWLPRYTWFFNDSRSVQTERLAITNGSSISAIATYDGDRPSASVRRHTNPGVVSARALIG